MDMSFEEWLEKLDEYVQEETGICLEDLPDMDYVEFYDDGCKFKDVLKIIMEENENYFEDSEDFDDDEDY